MTTCRREITITARCQLSSIWSRCMSMIWHTDTHFASGNMSCFHELDLRRRFYLLLSSYLSSACSFSAPTLSSVCSLSFPLYFSFQIKTICTLPQLCETAFQLDASPSPIPIAVSLQPRGSLAPFAAAPPEAS